MRYRQTNDRRQTTLYASLDL